MNEFTVQPEHLAGLEALLFVHGEPLAVSTIATTLNLSEDEVSQTVNALETRLQEDHRGICLISNGKKVQFATKPSLSNVLQEFAKTQLTEDLTPAALEVLSIVSYCAPIMRSEIEHIRGVNCAITLRNLMVRGLIEKTEQLNSQQEVSYVPTFELLRHLGVTRREELPEYTSHGEGKPTRLDRRSKPPSLWEICQKTTYAATTDDMW
jgi:segregation and condensation protein B